MRHTLKERMDKRILIYDGAMGTLLQSAGMQPGECPEMWNIDHPEAVMSIHEAYFRSGSDLVLTNSFGGSSIKLAEYHLGDMAYEINRAAGQIAKAASLKHGGLAVGTIGPCGQFIEPYGRMTFDRVFDSFKEQARGLVDGGVDAINVETMADLSELRAAMIAVKEVTSLPVICQMTFADRNRTVLGTDPTTAVTVMEGLGADVVGANCSGGPQELYPVLEEMAKITHLPLVVKPNAGLPQLIHGKTVFPATPAMMAEYAERFAQLGVAIIGGCCGNTPAHIQAISNQIGKRKPINRDIPYTGRLASRTKTIWMMGHDIVIVGERINPTGKKKLKVDMQSGEMALVQELAKTQETAGADVLDINVGAPGINEKEAMEQAVQAVSKVSHCPVAIDSTNVDILETILRTYPGKALVNSVTGKQDQLRAILPIVKKYGAGIVGLTMDENGLPSSVDDRIRIGQVIVQTAKEYGIRAEDIYLDCLVMTAAAQAGAPLETLNALRRVKSELGVGTIAGVSNVSHGLPARDKLNSVYLAALLGAGLDAAIIDPMEPKNREVLQAWSVISGTDTGAAAYIASNQNIAANTAAFHLEGMLLDDANRLRVAIINGDKANAGRIAEACMTMGWSPMDLVDQVMIPALDEVGRGYEEGRLYLPQLMLSAEAAERSFAYLKKNMDPNAVISRGKVIMATVKGDIHDIGKNIVSVLLENYGYSVIDLGKDVPSERIIEAIVREKAQVVGLSALMTTTMIEMKKTMESIQSMGLPVKTIVGGAVITPEYASEIGADAYGADAQDAVRKVAELMAT